MPDKDEFLLAWNPDDGSIRAAKYALDDLVRKLRQNRKFEALQNDLDAGQKLLSRRSPRWVIVNDLLVRPLRQIVDEDSGSDISKDAHRFLSWQERALADR
jgi:hypothetical protein